RADRRNQAHQAGHPGRYLCRAGQADRDDLPAGGRLHHLRNGRCDGLCPDQDLLGTEGQDGNGGRLVERGRQKPDGRHRRQDPSRRAQVLRGSRVRDHGRPALREAGRVAPRPSAPGAGCAETAAGPAGIIANPVIPLATTARVVWSALGAASIAFHLWLIFSGLIPNLVSRPLHMALALPWAMIFIARTPTERITGALFGSL